MQTQQQQIEPTNIDSEIITTQAADTRNLSVFYIGDFLQSSQKLAAALRMGGKFLPEVRTLPNNFIQKCAITRLRQGMISVHSNLIEKSQRPLYIRSYRATNVWNAGTQAFEDISVGTSGASLGLLFKPVYPISELGQIAGKNDGVVYIPHLESTSDIKDAQLHYFPDWIEILTGRKQLPKRLAELEDQLNERINKTNNAAMSDVGRAMLQSAAAYRLFGKTYVDYQTSAIKDAEKVAGVFQRYDEIAERLMTELDLTRADALMADFAKNTYNSAATTDKIADAITLLAQKSTGDEKGADTNVMDMLSKQTEMMSMMATAMGQLSSVVANIQNAQQYANVPVPHAAMPPVPASMAEFERALGSDDIGEQVGAEEADEVIDADKGALHQNKPIKKK